MFLNIFFLMLMLILISISAENPSPHYIDNPLLAIGFTACLYIFTVLLIYFQNMRLGRFASCHKSRMSLFANFELALFFISYYFIFGIHHLIFRGDFIFASTSSALFSMLLYLGGLAVFEYAQNKLHYKNQIALSKTFMQLKLFIPFLLPFFVFLFLSDLSTLINWQNVFSALGITPNSYAEQFAYLFIGLIFVLTMMALIPRMVVLCWQCKDLEESDLKHKLLSLCQKAKFGCAGLKTWGVLQDSLTAAIIGVWRPFRYVMFTPALLRQLSPNAVEAILAHEIGHSKCRHLLFYPFIILGIFLAGSFLAFQFYLMLMQFLANYVNLSAESWSILSSVSLFIILAAILAILFRLIFGYFSRLFERQADLYVFRLGIPAANLIEAFNDIAIATGNTHNVPNWHHYSLQQRIDFLNKAEKNPSLIYDHHRKVRLSLIAYSICLGAFLYLIY